MNILRRKQSDVSSTTGIMGTVGCQSPPLTWGGAGAPGGALGT